MDAKEFKARWLEFRANLCNNLDRIPFEEVDKANGDLKKLTKLIVEHYNLKDIKEGDSKNLQAERMIANTVGFPVGEWPDPGREGIHPEVGTTSGTDFLADQDPKEGREGHVYESGRPRTDRSPILLEGNVDHDEQQANEVRAQDSFATPYIDLDNKEKPVERKDAAPNQDAPSSGKTATTTKTKKAKK